MPERPPWFANLVPSGHEDLDQIFSRQAAMLARHEFATPDDVVALMDDTFKPESAADEIRKQSRRVKVESYARKLDQVADWKSWVGALGIRLKGLRTLTIFQLLLLHLTFLRVDVL